MLRYVLRRFLLLIPMVLAASVIIFLMLRSALATWRLIICVYLTCRRRRRCWPLPALMLGLDQPLYVQYGTLAMEGAASDFGISFASQRPVLDDMLNFLPATLELAGAALVLILLTSVPSVSGRRATAIACPISPSVSSRFACQMLNFWLAFLLVMAFSVYLQWLPAMGWRLAAHHFACGIHRLYVAGD